ncbi:Rne/Rng family ribonuclease [Paenibacillus koleovorans]|uniref:Rne/Rng family ribonuclease n=1 Tax=Paenibacillus koleovorans TaxID=121608 RepID=UPI000FD982FC|nr:Rne/Rng family ribonuclease [Paenibacillus koleovorans]
MKQIVVQCRDGETQVAVLEDGLLAEYYNERPVKGQLVGNVYKGKVVNVLPGMQAAFVHIGLEKNAFIYIDDVLPAHLDQVPRVKPPITELLKEGQELIVQIAKESLGTKGARVTTHFSLPGRWIVYMPYADYVGVSRKIDNEAERTRLKDIAERIRRPGEGLIIRTVAEGENADALERDLNMLRSEWTRVLERAERAKVPELLFREPGVLERLVRDSFTEQVDELVIDDRDKAAEVGRLTREMGLKLEGRIRVQRDESGKALHHVIGVHQQLETALQRKVWLKSGGYLIIDRTEALTVIDVNTGKYTGNSSLEDTVFTTNMEAAEQIGRLLRLRDIGGIIIVDFIDMASERSRTAIAEHLSEIMKRDRTKSLVVGWTRLGLLELTRKKVRESLDESRSIPCSHCGGSGRVVAPNAPPPPPSKPRTTHRPK